MVVRSEWPVVVFVRVRGNWKSDCPIDRWWPDTHVRIHPRCVYIHRYIAVCSSVRPAMHPAVIPTMVILMDPVLESRVAGDAECFTTLRATIYEWSLRSALAHLPVYASLPRDTDRRPFNVPYSGILAATSQICISWSRNIHLHRLTREEEMLISTRSFIIRELIATIRIINRIINFIIYNYDI